MKVLLQTSIHTSVILLIIIVTFLIAFNAGMVVGSTHNSHSQSHNRAAAIIIANNQFDGPNPFRFLQQGAGGAGTLECRVVDECSLCDAVSRKEVPECATTGRIERLICESPTKDDGDDEDDEGEVETSSGGVFASKSMYRSCLRTKADDEFLMVRMQVICVLIGAIAFMSVRREKRVSASLFDQRKLAEQAKRKSRRDSSNDTSTDIEMARLEETVPLTSSMSNDLEEV